ncbi:MAG: copper resistance protein NlpE [Raineya sp.]|jgi:hypothetical protein|nr:copper resistance protein NlpE [Raineya sp.]
MKKILVSLIAVMGLMLLTSSYQLVHYDTNILRKWKLSWNAVYQSFTASQKEYFDALSETEKQESINSINKATIEFKSDGSFVRIYSDESIENGTWTLTQSSTKLTLIVTNKPNEVYQVEILSPNQLIIKQNGYQSSYIPF